MLFKVMESGTKKTFTLKPHMKWLSFTFGTPESDGSVLGYLKEERMTFIDFQHIFNFDAKRGGWVGHRIGFTLTLSLGNIDM